MKKTSPLMNILLRQDYEAIKLLGVHIICLNELLHF